MLLEVHNGFGLRETPLLRRGFDLSEVSQQIYYPIHELAVLCVMERPYFSD